MQYTHAHSVDTLFNLGKAEGSIDAGQMIKPALARGLQLVGATTREYILSAMSQSRMNDLDVISLPSG